MLPELQKMLVHQPNDVSMQIGHRTALSNEKLLAEEQEKTRRELEIREIRRGGDAENA